MWRLGHKDNPVAYVPRDLSSWQHRWDDPRRQYRTLYCAEQPETCLAEVLADLRPSTKTLADLTAVMGEIPDLRDAAGTVTAAWRAAHVLQAARPRLDGPLADVEQLDVRVDLERRHAALLAAHGMDHLDLSELRSRTRIVTQTISRDLYERAYSGVAFASNIDGRRCFALFEGRATLEAEGAPIALHHDLEALRTVTAELGLRLDHD